MIITYHFDKVVWFICESGIYLIKLIVNYLYNN
jgi:hypothetical protein